jgi:hypothetical protein
MLFIIYSSYIFLIPPLLEARAEIQKKNHWVFLVQMKSLEFAFKINWPLVANRDRIEIIKAKWSYGFHKLATQYSKKIHI